MKKTSIVHIYNFIRMSHTEPSRFLADDFDTLRRILILVKQYGFPGTYALKYDALMEPRYQDLLREYLDGGISTAMPRKALLLPMEFCFV